MSDKKCRGRISVPVSTAYYVEQIQHNWINTAEREIWIHGIDMNTDSYRGTEPGVEYMMANKVIKNLHILRHQSASLPITIHLHTCGGLWEEGMAIYDTIRLMPYLVTIISYTHARSMSSIIFQAGDRRIMLPNSYFMFHLGTMNFDGEARTFQSNSDFARLNNKKMIDIYVNKAKTGPKFQDWSDAKIRSLINREMEKKSDVFLEPEEAINWGFADEILTVWPN